VIAEKKAHAVGELTGRGNRQAICLHTSLNAFGKMLFEKPQIKMIIKNQPGSNISCF